MADRKYLRILFYGSIHILTVAICLVIVYIIVIFFISSNSNHTVAIDYTPEDTKSLKELDALVKEHQRYDDANQQYIDSLEQNIQHIGSPITQEDMVRATELCNHVCYFSYDQATESLNLLVYFATNLKDEEQLCKARLTRARILTNAGLYGTGQDSLHHAMEQCATTELLFLHHMYMGFSYIELSEYNIKGPISEKNLQRGFEWLDKALALVPDHPMSFYMRGVYAAQLDSVDLACHYFHESLQRHDDSDHYELSLLNTALGHAYEKVGDYHLALHYYILAAKINIMQSYRDEDALSSLAKLLYYKFGDLDRSSEYLRLAINNATEYGSRVRVNRIGSLMPLLSEQQLSRERHSRQVLQWLSASIFVLMVVLAFMLWFYLQRNKLLNESRRNLKITNKKLDEANNVKNAYLGIFLNTQSSISQEMGNFAIIANQKLKMQKYNDLQRLINDLEVKFNKRQTLFAFDEAINTIFPSFLEELNSLLRPECQLEQKSNHELPPMARIFAMIRLGVMDNKEIARALNYTYNTVLNYRVRMRNMSYDPEKFEEEVSKISL